MKTFFTLQGIISFFTYFISTNTGYSMPIFGGSQGLGHLENSTTRCLTLCGAASYCGVDRHQRMKMTYLGWEKTKLLPATSRQKLHVSKSPYCLKQRSQKERGAKKFSTFTSSLSSEDLFIPGGFPYSVWNQRIKVRNATQKGISFFFMRHRIENRINCVKGFQLDPNKTQSRHSAPLAFHWTFTVSFWKYEFFNFSF